jgi:2-polyprenyl-3-methyl-5-hydroxy-6-metoxy-1,4-benzoquinol methylase
MEFQSVRACPACGQAAARPWLDPEVAGVFFHLDKCSACGTGYLNPPPSRESVQGMYADTGHGAKSLTSLEAVMAGEAEFPNSTVDARRLVSYAQKLLGPEQGERTALDIGSGYGFFSQAALARGFKVTAVNPAAAENRIFKRLNGFAPREQFFEAVDFGEARFDLVILSQILEHLLEPRSVLLKIRRLVKPQGVIAIAVPNVDAILIKLLKSKSSFLGLPEHIIHFSQQGLAALLGRTGFEVKHHRYYSRIPYYTLSNKLNLRGELRRLVNYAVKIGQGAPLALADRWGLGLFQNVWAMPAVGEKG